MRNLESYAFLQEAGLGGYTAADYSIYTMNHEAQRFWEERSIVRDTVPLELNQYELARRDNSRSEMIVYGYLPMMVSAPVRKKDHGRLQRKKFPGDAQRPLRKRVSGKVLL